MSRYYLNISKALNEKTIWDENKKKTALIVSHKI